MFNIEKNHCDDYCIYLNDGDICICIGINDCKDPDIEYFLIYKYFGNNCYKILLSIFEPKYIYKYENFVLDNNDKQKIMNILDNNKTWNYCMNILRDYYNEYNEYNKCDIQLPNKCPNYLLL